jgi:hypothetical protein
MGVLVMALASLELAPGAHAAEMTGPVGRAITPEVIELRLVAACVLLSLRQSASTETWEEDLIGKLRSGVALALLAGMGVAEAQVACESLKGYQAPDVKITAATPATSPVPLCKVDGVIGKEINFSVWLPEAWNGKFVMGGQGGFAGRVENQAMSLQALQKGYATAGTDMLGFPVAVSALAFASVGMILTPGGIGAYAFLLAKVLEQNGVDYTLGVANGTLQWFAQVMIVVIVGGISLLVLPFYNKKPQHEGR